MNTLNILLVTQFGWTVALVGYLIVFAALVCLVFIFMGLSKLMNMNLRSKLQRKGKVVENDEDLVVEGDVNAAIATALHLYFSEMHDEESGVITIQKVDRRYSPWSSKIYGVNNNQPRG